MMKYLLVKMRRDLFSKWSQFVSVFLMACLGVIIYSGMEGAWYGMQTGINSYLNNTNTASAWIYGRGINDNDINKIKKFKNVKDSTYAMSSNVKMKVTNGGRKPDINIVSVSNNTISKPIVVSGKKFNNDGNGIWIDKSFANEHSLKVGDKIEIQYGQITKKIVIRGIIISSEYIYYTGSSGSLSPDHKLYGYAWISKDATEDMFNEIDANEIQQNVISKIKYNINGILKSHPGMPESMIKPVIMKANGLNEAQYESFNEMLSFPNISSVKNADQKRYISKKIIADVENIPSILKSYNNMSGVTLEDSSINYNQIRVTLKNDSNTDGIKQKAKDILGNRYIRFQSRDNFNPIASAFQKVQQLKRMGNIFSILFLLLAMITMQTAMARLVDTQRIQIGTMKALGLYKKEIQMHYVGYGIIVGILGGVCGLIIAPFTVTPIILKIQAKIYTLPELKGMLTIVSYCIVVAIGICCALSTLIACRNGLKGMPAETMRGLTLKAGKKSLIQRTPFIWNKLSFWWKWSFSDITRKRLRSAMGIIAVIGCMTLLMASFGMQNSQDYALNYIYNKQYTYKNKIVLNRGCNEQNRNELLNMVKSGGFIEENSVELKKATDNQTRVITIVDKGSYINLKNENGEQIKFPSNGVYVTRRTAKDLNLKKGDMIEFRIIGEKKYVRKPIKDIVLTPSPQGIFISAKEWKKLDEKFIPTALLTKNEHVSSSIKNLSYVNEVLSIQNQIDNYETFVKGLSAVYFLLKFSAILLCIIILYNIGVLSYTERTQEYATLKVLGFYQKEISSLAIREGIVCTFIGWLISIPVGLHFLNMYVNTISDYSYDGIPKLTITSFVISTIITVGCSIIINLLIIRKVKKINMVEALKALE
ncbi:ABC transporter permease [Clostridium felsineum]|uniref:ABC transporter permease n=1 Tax=Clostridium felsineum TaxID=36839 RepID=UPI00214DCA94|nr:ABC transporter permease [Clostridium felsineum]MCR3758493.1 ABC transporter permease [Clostridium felsineum]